MKGKITTLEPKAAKKPVNEQKQLHPKRSRKGMKGKISTLKSKAAKNPFNEQKQPHDHPKRPRKGRQSKIAAEKGQQLAYFHTAGKSQLSRVVGDSAQICEAMGSTPRGSFVVWFWVGMAALGFGFQVTLPFNEQKQHDHPKRPRRE